MYVIKTEGVDFLNIALIWEEKWKEGVKINTLFTEGFHFVETLNFFPQNIVSVVLTLLLYVAVQDQMVLLEKVFCCQMID